MGGFDRIIRSLARRRASRKRRQGRARAFAGASLEGRFGRAIHYQARGHCGRGNSVQIDAVGWRVFDRVTRNGSTAPATPVRSPASRRCQDVAPHRQRAEEGQHR